MLGLIGSAAFGKGLDLLTSLQPAVKPLIAISNGLIQALLQRNRNVAVQHFRMGLDFGSDESGARLAEGDYIIMQAPSDLVGIDTLAYSRTKATLVTNDDAHLPFKKFNYVVIAVKQWEDDAGPAPEARG